MQRARHATEVDATFNVTCGIATDRAACSYAMSNSATCIMRRCDHATCDASTMSCATAETDAVRKHAPRSLPPITAQLATADRLVSTICGALLRRVVRVLQHIYTELQRAVRRQVERNDRLGSASASGGFGPSGAMDEESSRRGTEINKSSTGFSWETASTIKEVAASKKKTAGKRKRCGRALVLEPLARCVLDVVSRPPSQAQRALVPTLGPSGRKEGHAACASLSVVVLSHCGTPQGRRRRTTLTRMIPKATRIVTSMTWTPRTITMA